MTDQPSEAALRKASSVLGYDFHPSMGVLESVRSLARHFDAEDKAAREASGSADSTVLRAFVHRHILPDPKPTVEQVVAKAISGVYPDVGKIAQALRDAGLLRET